MVKGAHYGSKVHYFDRKYTIFRAKCVQKRVFGQMGTILVKSAQFWSNVRNFGKKCAILVRVELFGSMVREICKEYTISVKSAQFWLKA